MIEIENITIKNRNFEIRDLSLTISTKSFHCLIGPTGCGKTTLLEAILGLRKLSKGRILLEGIDISSVPVHKRGFSYVPQDLAIFPHLTVKENIFYGIKYGKKHPKAHLYDNAIEISKQLGIYNLLDRRVAGLSGGEKQRVALTRALATGNRYILLDEPLSSLHEGMKKELWYLLKDIQNRFSATIVMVSHDLDETFFLGDYISIMLDGKIQQTGTKDEIYNNPANIKTATFLGIKNIFKLEMIKDGRFFSPDLDTEITIKNIDQTILKKEPLHFGIRSENIMIARADLKKPNQENVIECQIHRVHKKMTSYTVICKLPNKDTQIEIEVPPYAFQKLALEEKAKVEIYLLSEKIFLLSEN